MTEDALQKVSHDTRSVVRAEGKTEDQTYDLCASFFSCKDNRVMI